MTSKEWFDLYIELRRDQEADELQELPPGSQVPVSPRMSKHLETFDALLSKARQKWGERGRDLETKTIEHDNRDQPRYETTVGGFRIRVFDISGYCYIIDECDVTHYYCFPEDLDQITPAISTLARENDIDWCVGETRGCLRLSAQVRVRRHGLCSGDALSGLMAECCRLCGRRGATFGPTLTSVGQGHCFDSSRIRKDLSLWEARQESSLKSAIDELQAARDEVKCLLDERLPQPGTES